MHYRIPSIVLIVVLCAAAAPCQNVLYGSDVFLDDIGAIDRTTAAWSTIGGTLVGGAITGLAYDPNGDVLYGCRPNDNALYTVDQSTGAATFVGATGFSNINGLAYDPNNNILYCTSLNGNMLFTVDVATGSGTAIGQISGASGVEGLGYDPATDTLYGLDDISDTVVILNTTTAAATPLPSGMASSGLWRGLTWDSELGVIWATKVNPGELHSVDPVTGISTFIGFPQSFVQGIAFKGSGGPTEYEVNKPEASFDINGVQGTPTSFAAAVVLAGQVATANLSSTNPGQLWDMAVGTTPLLPASAGAPVIGGQLLNVNPSDPSLTLLWNGFLSPPFASFSTPLSFAAPTTLSLQMAVTDPLSPSGIALSQPVRFIVQ